MLFAKNLLLDKLGVNGSTPTHPKIPELQPSSSGSKKLGVDESRGDERIQLWSQHYKPTLLHCVRFQKELLLYCYTLNPRPGSLTWGQDNCLCLPI